MGVTNNLLTGVTHPSHQALDSEVQLLRLPLPLKKCHPEIEGGGQHGIPIGCMYGKFLGSYAQLSCAETNMSPLPRCLGRREILFKAGICFEL